MTESPQPHKVKTISWTLLLIPEKITIDSPVRLASVFEAPEGMTAGEIVSKTQLAVKGMGVEQQIHRLKPKRGISSPIQIQDVPEPSSEFWKNIPEINRPALHYLAVFNTQMEFANLIGVDHSIVSQALYNARRSIGKGNIATVRGFKIARLEDIESK